MIVTLFLLLLVCFVLFFVPPRVLFDFLLFELDTRLFVDFVVVSTFDLLDT